MVKKEKKDIEPFNEVIVFFVLIKTLPLYEKRVYDRLKKVRLIVEITPLLGEWDILIKCFIPSKYNPWIIQTEFIEKQIRSIEGKI